MLNLNAKQISDLQISRLDNATLLSAVEQTSLHVQHSAVARQKLGSIADAFVSAANAYDVAYNPSQKDLLTDVVAELDKVRDKAQTAWHENILAGQRSPNEQKAMVARQLVQLYKDYHLETADEYMKQTTNISQMIQNIEGNATIMAALPTMGLDDYLVDLKQKNEAFAAKVAERTAGTVGREKGVVAAARTAVEKALRDLIRATNVVSIYEGDGGLDQFIDTVNAEIEHYRQILARKGGGSGSSSSGSSSSGNSGSGSSSGNSNGGSSNSGNSGGTTDSGNTGTTEPGGSGTGSITPVDNTGGDDNQGGGTGTDTPENPGGNSGGTGSITPTNPGDDNGGDSGGGNNSGGGGGNDEFN